MGEGGGGGRTKFSVFRFAFPFEPRNEKFNLEIAKIRHNPKKGKEVGTIRVVGEGGGGEGGLQLV